MSAPSSRPLLLPQNRKLRHLRGISLRNLSFVRPRGQATDDAAINKTADKLESLREGSQLHHAQSTESLRRPAARRRSTTLAAASPLTRQKMLELTVDSLVADAFFSLHRRTEEDPFYISELAERATNFDFRFFELHQLDSSITRSPQFTVKIWTRRQGRWGLLVEEDLDLRFLKFLGGLQNIHFPANCLVFHLIDGVYALELPEKVAPPKQGLPLPTSSYNVLMKLATLDGSIQDALATRDSITQQINDILAHKKDSELPQAQDEAHLADKYAGQQRRSNKAAERRRDELRASITARRTAMRDGKAAQGRAESDVEHATDKLLESKRLSEDTRERIRGQRRRVCEDLTSIYRIVPVPMGPPLSFQICGLALPNTAYDSLAKGGAAGGEDVISAALGLVAQLTHHLQFYLGVPLPYEITPFGSRSSIRDDISMLPDPQRDFPLYLPKGGSTAQFRFDYAWFLLNKDVEALCMSQGLKVVDIRHTLPNLKYLLYVCSAGTDELPERKKGGVRGLWAGRMKARGIGMADDGLSSSAGSRRGSADSEVLSRQRDELRKAIKENAGGGGGRDASTSPPTASASPLALPFGEEETKLTLRTKGLRENVVR